MRLSALGLMIRFGLWGGLLASVAVWIPALYMPSVDPRWATYLSQLVVLLSVPLGVRAVIRHRGQDSFRIRVSVGAGLAAMQAGLVSFALYVLYAWLRPGLLLARALAHQAQAGVSTERQVILASAPTQAVDPAFQAFEGGVLIFFMALLLVGYLALRQRLLARLQRR
jgi:hypothetical protein